MFPGHEICRFEVQIDTNSFCCQEDSAAGGTGRHIVEINSHVELVMYSENEINKDSQAAKFCEHCSENLQYIIQCTTEKQAMKGITIEQIHSVSSLNMTIGPLEEVPPCTKTLLQVRYQKKKNHEKQRCYEGCTIAQVISHWLPTAAARVRTRV
jgi:hypothetical protein